ncbi:MAG TPA: DUF2306 domain-containing protein [Sphingomicrobium sp.]|nr:DUF2306 domain-containing protein [Sphingomicrobium sp.]
MRFSWSAAVTALAVAGFLYLVVRFLLFSVPGVATHPADKHWAYWLHIGGGTLVMLLGPFQFIAPIRNRFRRYHRFAGYSFVAGSVAAFAGYWAVQPTKEDTFFLSQATAMSLWMVAMVAAVIAARRKRFLTHQHNMARAFVLAAYFVVVRLVDKYGMGLVELGASNKDVAFAHSDWITWVVPLVLVEAYYGRKWDALLKRRARGAP